ncbi:MAG: DUF6624 domain-containing protein [Bacteroidota bacterium]
MKYSVIAKTILQLQQADLQLRDQLIQKRLLGKGHHPAMEKLHNENAQKLAKIMNDIGYPTIAKVGKEASDAAWLIIQHAISQPAFMKKCLQSLREAVKNQEANPKNVAYLSDRIATFEDQPQLYGTAFDWDESGQLSPKPFNDLEKVNQRRKSLGMNTLEEQTKLMRQRAKKEYEEPPADFEQRKQEYNVWRRKVGWIK